MSTDIREVTVLIDGEARVRVTTVMGDAELGMALSRWVPQMEGRVCVVVTGPDLVRRIVCRSRGRT
jgi:hypothetical protein